MNTVSNDTGFSYFTPFTDKPTSVLEQSLVSHLGAASTFSSRDLSTPVPQVSQGLSTSMSLPPFPVPSPMSSLQFPFSADPTTLAANVAAMVNLSQLGNTVTPLSTMSTPSLITPATRPPQAFPSTSTFRYVVDQINVDNVMGHSTAKLLEGPSNISLPSTSFNIGVLCGDALSLTPPTIPMNMRSRRGRRSADNSSSSDPNTPEWVVKQAESLLPKVFQDIYESSKSKEKSTTTILKEIYRTQSGTRSQPEQEDTDFKRRLHSFAMMQVENSKTPRSRVNGDGANSKNGVLGNGERDWALNKTRWADAARKRREKMSDDEKREQKAKWAQAARRRYHNLTTDQKKALGQRQSERKKRKVLETNIGAQVGPITETNSSVPPPPPELSLQHHDLESSSLYLLKDIGYNNLRF